MRGCGARRAGSWAKKLTRNPRTSANEIPRMHMGMVSPVKHGRTSGRSALRNSAHTEHRFLGLDAGNRDASRMNMDAAHVTQRSPRMHVGMAPPVRRERISGRPALRSRVHTEDRFLGRDAGDRNVSRMDLDTENCSELPRLYMGPEAGDVAPRRYRGELRRNVPGSTRGLRVNMIRTRGGKVGVTEDQEPRFGGSRAAPLQGADRGRPSRSANDRGANDDASDSEAEGGPRAGGRRRRLPEVPYSTASSEEWYRGTDDGSRSRAKSPETHSKKNNKTSTLVPEVGFEPTRTYVHWIRYVSDTCFEFR